MINISISSSTARAVLTLVVVAIFVWVVSVGFIAGRDLARSRATVTRALVLQQGVKLFFEDQSRYPSELEYQNGERLGVYLQNFPGPFFTHKKWCTMIPRYSSRGGASFGYDFCLPRGWKEWTRGWHSMDERTL